MTVVMMPAYKTTQQPATIVMLVEICSGFMVVVVMAMGGHGKKRLYQWAKIMV